MKRSWFVAAVALMASMAPACECVYPPGSWAAVSDEAALLIWDEVHQTEHFIRRITFEHEGQDFGFLIQTPTVPEIKDADSKIFESIEKFLHSVELRDGASKAADEPVKVLAVQHAAGLLATTLKTDSADALIRWMSKHGYRFDEHTKRWAQPYLDKHWPITTFKIDDAEPQHDSKHKAMRLSFKTPKLFYPYRGFQKPKQPGQKVPDRSLSLDVLASTPVSGTRNGKPWATTARESGIPATSSLLQEISDATGVPQEVLERSDRITAFHEDVPAATRTDDLWVAATSGATGANAGGTGAGFSASGRNLAVVGGGAAAILGICYALGRGCKASPQ